MFWIKLITFKCQNIFVWTLSNFIWQLFCLVGRKDSYGNISQYHYANPDKPYLLTQVYQPRDMKMTSLVYDHQDHLIFVQINQVGDRLVANQKINNMMSAFSPGSFLCCYRLCGRSIVGLPGWWDSCQGDQSESVRTDHLRLQPQHQDPHWHLWWYSGSVFSLLFHCSTIYNCLCCLVFCIPNSPL